MSTIRARNAASTEADVRLTTTGGDPKSVFTTTNVGQAIGGMRLSEVVGALPPGFADLRFARTGGPQAFDVSDGDVVAMEPTALGKMFLPGFFGAEKPQFDRRGPLALVSIDGPLMQRAGWFWDGYDAIKARFAAAMADSTVNAVVLKINSPGGMCAGCFETVDAMNRIKAQSKKPVYAFADEMAASAAYALASVADEIWLPKSGLVGSVGTVITLAEESAALAKYGVRVVVITTGKQKADGHSAVPLTEEVIKRFAARADYLNSLFVSQVAASRSMTSTDVLGLEAAVFYGDSAVKAKLADGVSSFDDFIAAKTEQAKTMTASRAAAAAIAAEDSSMGDNANSSAPSGATGLLPLIAALLGAASSSEADVQARARELGEVDRELLRATGKASTAEALGAVKAWKVSHEALAVVQADLKAAREREQKQELDGLIANAKASGKITNAALEQTCRELGTASPAQLRALIEALPVVGGGTLASSATTEPAHDGEKLTQTDIEIAQSLGLTSEEFAKARRDENARKAG
jgi:signal peptide peptidase SppA